MTKNNIKISPDSHTLVTEISQWIPEIVRSAIAQRGQAAIALAGGSTPKVIYQALASANLPWEQLQIFWGDERYVPATDPQSNELMVRQSWLNLVPIPAANIHPWPTTAGQPEQCALQYQAEILSCFKISAGQVPRFDLILLGMGEDGHTASLFPHTPALAVIDRLTTVGSKDGEPRLTMTTTLINQAHCVAFIVTGANKQAALQQVFSTTAATQQYPAKLIQPNGELWWWLDQSAAEVLA
jgi:6-phosphogluconolactonase